MTTLGAHRISTGLISAGLAISLLGGCATVPETASPTQPDRRTTAQFLAEVPDADWEEIAAEDLLVMEWAGEEGEDPRRVVIRLPDLAYGSQWSANVRAIAREGYWDAAGIYRVIPPFVAQWGIIPPAEPVQAEPEEPAYLLEPEPGSFVAPLSSAASPDLCRRSQTGNGGVCDAYASQVRIVDGWVFGSDGAEMWPLFCRGTVGVARGLDNQGSGSALYAVLRTDHRNMDRNIGMVGRVIEGLSLLEDLPAATGPGGTYTDRADIPVITRYVLASDLPVEERPRYRMIRHGSASHAAWLARLVQPDPFYATRYGAAAACDNIVPVAPVES